MNRLSAREIEEKNTDVVAILVKPRIAENGIATR